MMAHLSDEANALGAINCVINRDGELHGDNTDARGLELDLRDAGVEVQGRTVVIIGAGGAAASAILASIRMGASRVIVCNRTVPRAIALADRLAHPSRVSGKERASTIEACGLEMLADAAGLAEIAVMINATPMGLKTGNFAEIAYRATSAECVFYDMIYARDATPFIAPALALGRRALDGAGMLINQGALAFELFNDVSAPAGVMRTALMAALGRQTTI
jgi:shikimate dehydrogenase